MHTIEERIQRLETSCRRWKLLTLTVAGLTVAHFAMRQPLEAQSQASPKEIRAESVVCNSINIVDELNGKVASRAHIKAEKDSVELTLNSGEMNFVIVLSRFMGNDHAHLSCSDNRGRFALSPHLLSFDRDRNHLSLSPVMLSFAREDEEGARIRQRQDEITSQLGRLIAQSKKLDSDTQQEFRELTEKYDEHVHKTFNVGTNQQGGGSLSLMNVFGEDVIEAYADRKNGGQLLIRNADKEVLHALPPGKRQ